MIGLLIFDVDGTLCDTYGVDDEFYCAAASSLLGRPVLPGAWEQAPQITDTGIASWLWTRHLGRSPQPDELEALATTFEAALRHELARAPERFAAVAGAGQFLSTVRSRGWHVAYATGGWYRTARLKLRAAGLPTEHLMASSDDSPDRLEIFRLAHARVAHVLRETPQRTVLFGDGVWDVQVATHLGWPFVGIGGGERAERLVQAGATTVLSDFTDSSLALAALPP